MIKVDNCPIKLFGHFIQLTGSSEHLLVTFVNYLLIYARLYSFHQLAMAFIDREYFSQQNWGLCSQILRK